MVTLVKAKATAVETKLSIKQAYAKLPLVYSCSGCSSAAQLANNLAVRSDRERLAEMSCIAGVGGDVRSLLKTAKSDRQVLVLDGCPLHCAQKALERHEITATTHLDLSTFGVKKRYHEDASCEERERVWSEYVLPSLTKLQK